MTRLTISSGTGQRTTATVLGSEVAAGAVRFGFTDAAFGG